MCEIQYIVVWRVPHFKTTHRECVSDCRSCARRESWCWCWLLSRLITSLSDSNGELCQWQAAASREKIDLNRFNASEDKTHKHTSHTAAALGLDSFTPVNA